MQQTISIYWFRFGGPGASQNAGTINPLHPDLFEEEVGQSVGASQDGRFGNWGWFQNSVQTYFGNILGNNLNVLLSIVGFLNICWKQLENSLPKSIIIVVLEIVSCVPCAMPLS